MVGGAGFPRGMSAGQKRKVKTKEERKGRDMAISPVLTRRVKEQLQELRASPMWSQEVEQGRATLCFSCHDDLCETYPTSVRQLARSLRSLLRALVGLEANMSAVTIGTSLPLGASCPSYVAGIGQEAGGRLQLAGEDFELCERLIDVGNQTMASRELMFQPPPTSSPTSFILSWFQSQEGLQLTEPRPLPSQTDASGLEEPASRLPPLFFGTFQLRGEDAFRATQQAMQLGYRAIDTASIYRNEEEVARGLAASGVVRGEVFITSKLAPNEQGYSKAMTALTSSLQRLDTPYLDLYLIHWPGAAKTPLESPANKRLRLESWQALQDALQLGMIWRAGVSNFCVHHLQELLACSEVVPCVNQVELHPACFQQELLQFCDANKIQVQAYSPLGSPAGVQSLLSHDAVLRVSEEEQVTAAQVLIRWAIQACGSAVVRSSNAQRLEENLASAQLPELSESSMERLNAVTPTDSDGKRILTKYCWDPSGVA